MTRDRLLTIRQVAEMTGEPQATIRRWIYERVLPCERTGPRRNRVRVRLSVLARFYPEDVLQPVDPA